MEGSSCGYCGYREETASNAANTAAAGQQPAAQPQVIINNQTVVSGDNVQGVSSKSKLVALLLSIFFGGLGIHRFYVGKIGTGILYLLTAGLFGIGWLVDIVLIACGSFKDSLGLPLRQ